MRKDTFKKLFSNGRGKAIQFLKEISPNTEKYEDIISTVCSTFTGLNLQSEGCNPEYYLSAISYCRNKINIVEKIQNKLFTNTDNESIEKTFTILLHLSNEYPFVIDGLKDFLTQRLILAKYDLGEYPRYNRDLFFGLCYDCLDFNFELGKFAMKLFIELCNVPGHEDNIDHWGYYEGDIKLFWPVVNDLGYSQIITDAHENIRKIREEYQNLNKSKRRKRPKREIIQTNEDLEIIDKLIRGKYPTGKYKFELWMCTYMDHVELGNPVDTKIALYFYENSRSGYYRYRALLMLDSINEIGSDILDEIKYDEYRRILDFANSD